MKSQTGFTLIELLVVLAIVGILAAISVSQYSAYMARAYDKEAQLTLRSTATAEEAYRIDNDAYVSCNETDCHILLSDLAIAPAGVTLQIVAAGDTFSGNATHARGSGEVYDW